MKKITLFLFLTFGISLFAEDGERMFERGLDGDFKDFTIEQLKEIIEKKGGSEPLTDELKMFPMADKFNISVSIIQEEKEVGTFQFTTNQKWVDQKYIVSSGQRPGANGLFYLVITFDAAANLYKKWSIQPDGSTTYYEGSRISGKREALWVSVSEEMKTIAIEKYSDEEETWEAIGISDGRELFRVIGKLTVVK